MAGSINPMQCTAFAVKAIPTKSSSLLVNLDFDSLADKTNSKHYSDNTTTNNGDLYRFLFKSGGWHFGCFKEGIDFV